MKHFYLAILSLFVGVVAYSQNCQTLTAPFIRISQVGFPNEKANASFCQGERVQLNVPAIAGVSYQWKRNDVNISGATGSTLVVDQPGTYTVGLSQQAPCTGSVLSDAINISTNQCGTGGLLPILGGQLEDYNGGASSLNAILLRAVYLTDAGSRNKFPLSIKAYVYRKRDKSLMTTVSMSRGSILDGQRTPLPAACNGDSSKIQEVLYFGSINFLSTVYNDPDGYFATTEPICCREVSDNINGTGPVVFYIEFGDRTKYNLATTRSTFGSIFGLPSRIETCVNQPVQLNSYASSSLNLSAVQYSFTSPTTGDASTPVKDVSWANTYGATTFMESAGPLQIDQYGTITGTPTKVGTFRYVVKAELYQGTFKGFELRRELALQVKECPAVVTPTVVISAVGKPNEAAKNIVCENSAVQLNAKTPLKNVDYQWYLDGKPVSGATDSILIARQEGRYTVMVSKELACPRSAISNPVSLTVTRNPSVSLIASAQMGALCQGSSLTLTAVSSATAVSFRWQRDTTSLGMVSGPVYQTDMAGNYIVTVTDINGCSGRSAALSVVTNSPPEASILPGTGRICPGSTLRLQANMGTNLSYQWVKDGLAIPGATSAVYESITAGIYAVIVKGPNSCTAASAPQSISVANAPTVTITGPTQLCRSSSVTLTANSNGVAQYQWLVNGSVQNGAITSTFEARTGGNYQVLVTDPNQCTATSTSWALAEIDKISISLDSISPFCGTAGSPVSLRGTPVGGSFSGNGVTGSQFSPTLAGIGAHEVTYSIVGPTTCQSGTAKRTIVVNPLPDATLPKEIGIQLGESVSLPGPVGSNYQYNWSPPTNLDNPSIARPLATPDTTTRYRLRIQDSFGCTSEGNILVFVISKLYIPDAFSPNGDNYNDIWQIRNISRFKNVDVTIFNRWGTVVFHSLGYDVPFDGQNLPDGVYTYSILYDAPQKRLVGTVVVAR